MGRKGGMAAAAAAIDEKLCPFAGETCQLSPQGSRRARARGIVCYVRDTAGSQARLTVSDPFQFRVALGAGR